MSDLLQRAADAAGSSASARASYAARAFLISLPCLPAQRDEGLDRVEQGGTEFGEFVVDPRRHDRKHGSGDEAFAFELSQREREHALADAVDLALQLAEPLRSVGKDADHEQRPLVGDAVEDRAHFALGIVGVGIAPVPR